MFSITLYVTCKGVPGNPGEPGLKGDKVICICLSQTTNLVFTRMLDVTDHEIVSLAPETDNRKAITRDLCNPALPWCIMIKYFFTNIQIIFSCFFVFSQGDFGISGEPGECGYQGDKVGIVFLYVFRWCSRSSMNNKICCSMPGFSYLPVKVFLARHRSPDCSSWLDQCLAGYLCLHLCVCLHQKALCSAV